MKEVLLDGNNYVNDDGDVVAIDRPQWEPIGPEMVFDHPTSSAVEPQPKTSIDYIDSRPPVAVSLEARAIAIEGIMRYFNQANKGVGLAKSRGYNDFDARYGRDAEFVVQGMSEKQARLYRAMSHHLGTLIAQNAQEARGVAPEDIERQRKDMAHDLYKQYGPGRAMAPDREKLVRRVKRTARGGRRTKKVA